MISPVENEHNIGFYFLMNSFRRWIRQNKVFCYKKRSHALIVHEEV